MDETWSLKKFRNRITPNYSNGILTIKILAVTHEDNGNYKLEVMYLNNPSSKCFIRANGTIMLHINGKTLIF